MRLLCLKLLTSYSDHLLLLCVCRVVFYTYDFSLRADNIIANAHALI